MNLTWCEKCRSYFWKSESGPNCSCKEYLVWEVDYHEEPEDGSKIHAKDFEEALRS